MFITLKKSLSWAIGLILISAVSLSGCVTVAPYYAHGEVSVQLNQPCDTSKVTASWGNLDFKFFTCFKKYVSNETIIYASFKDGFPSEPLWVKWKDAKGNVRSEKLDLAPLMKAADLYEPGTQLKVLLEADKIRVTVNETPRETLLDALLAKCTGSPFATNYACYHKSRSGELLVHPLKAPEPLTYRELLDFYFEAYNIRIP